MDNIEVGDYIKTDKGYIRKIKEINKDAKKIAIFGKYILDKPINHCYSIAFSRIKSYSKSIIDLIEVRRYFKNKR